MIEPTREEFERLAEGHDIVPVCRELIADLDTPVSVLARFADRENVFLLESMEGGEKWGRYSIIGLDAVPIFDLEHTDGATGRLDELRSIYAGLRVAQLSGLPRFFGGAVGFLAYESIGEVERMPDPKPSASVHPRTCFMQSDHLVVFDNVRHTVRLVACMRPADFGSAAEAYAAGLEQLQRTASALQAPAPKLPALPSGMDQNVEVAFESNISRDRFCEMVSQAKKYIVAGDIIQVVLSQRFSTLCDAEPIHLYRALRHLNPSPYTFFLKVGDKVLVGSSPEVMVRLEGNRVAVRPIAGTRPRGATEQEDRRLADELLSDEKEKAEHVMLVDLGRNDVGRVAQPGSVQVRELMTIERYSHVMHIVSHVEGLLREGQDAVDVIRATFPAGTLTGAPKIRAMEIIHELEPDPRGVYGGAVGYIGYTGDMDLAITIRTLEVEAGRVTVQAGAGIVYDSVPEREYDETCHKSEGMKRAVAMAVAAGKGGK